MDSTQTTVDLSVSIGGTRKGDPLRLANPVIAAAGTLGVGIEVQRDVDIFALGALVTPGISRRPSSRRTALVRETPSGLFVAGAYPTVRLRTVIERYVPLWEQWPMPVIANLPADDADDCVDMAAALADCASIAAIEVSLTPTVARLGGTEGGRELQQFCRRLVDLWPGPLIVKLPFGVAGLGMLIDAAAGGGADAVSLGGGFPARTVADNGRMVEGRVIGPATHPLALYELAEVATGAGIPLIASGGVTSAQGALDLLRAGAVAVQVGSASLRDPAAAAGVARGLESLVRSSGESSIAAFRLQWSQTQPPP